MAMTIEQWRALRAMNSQPVAPGTEGVASVVVQTKEGPKTVALKYILELPIQLAKLAGVPVEVYSLARCMASEGHSGSDYTLAMMLIGNVIMRVAKQSFSKATYPITTKVAYCVYSAVRWHYGQQSGRWASTMRPPTKWHIMLAESLLKGEVPDMSQGAHKFLSPWGPHAKQAGRELRPFPEVMDKWHNKDGYAWVGHIPGIEDMELALFRPETDKAKRDLAFNQIMGLWRAKFGGGGRESESEGPQLVSQNRKRFSPVPVLGAMLIGWGVTQAIKDWRK